MSGVVLYFIVFIVLVLENLLECKPFMPTLSSIF